MNAVKNSAPGGMMVPSERKEIATLKPILSLEEVRQSYNAVVQLYREVMKPELDYGKIPGTNKDTLLKPGAEKLCALFHLAIEDPEIVKAVEDWTGAEHSGEPFFYYLIRQRLTRHGELVASQLASCNSWESKYRYRKAERTCPKCGAAAIIKGKQEYGGGWVCFDKKGGCKAKFADGDPLIESQQTGRVKNADVADIANTILKMATKRALVAATVVATHCSDFFGQDMEDVAIIDADYEVKGAPPKPEPKPASPSIPDLIRKHGLEKIRQHLLTALQQEGASIESILARVKAHRPEEITAAHLESLHTDLSAIKEDMGQLAQRFPAPKPAKKPRLATKKTLAALELTMQQLKLTPADREELCAQVDVRSFADMEEESAQRILYDLSEALRKKQAQPPREREPGEGDGDDDPSVSEPRE